jgi:hypothetical protein
LWDFVNPQVEQTLLAQLIVDAALHENKRGEMDLARMNATARLRPDEEVDLAFVVLSLLDFESEPNRLDERCRSVYMMLTNASPATNANVFEYSLFRRLATNVVLRSRAVIGAKERAERTKMLLQSIGGTEFEGLHIVRALTSFDLTGQVFRRCLFQDVTFAGCKFDETTIFHTCRFEGGDANRCEGLGSAAFIDCTFSATGHEFVRGQQVKEGTKKYGNDDLCRDLRSLVEKFLRQAGSSFKTVHRNDLMKGKIATSPHMREVVAAFERHILEPARHSGEPSGGFAVKEGSRESVLFFHQNNSLVGDLATVAALVTSKLNLK